MFTWDTWRSADSRHPFCGVSFVKSTRRTRHKRGWRLSADLQVSQVNITTSSAAAFFI